MKQHITFIDSKTAILLQEQLIQRYGGSTGLRDISLLESALAQPQGGFGEDFFHEFPFGMAAAYLYHLAKNHPFVDGNKRIAFACARVFLLMHDYEMKATDEEKYELVLSVAAGDNISKEDIAEQLEAWCGGYSHHAQLGQLS